MLEGTQEGRVHGMAERTALLALCDLLTSLDNAHRAPQSIQSTRERSWIYKDGLSYVQDSFVSWLSHVTYLNRYDSNYQTKLRSSLILLSLTLVSSIKSGVNPKEVLGLSLVDTLLR